jgi:hypothetical protein
MMCQWETQTHPEGAQTQELGEIKHCIFGLVGARYSQITMNRHFNPLHVFR